MCTNQREIVNKYTGHKLYVKCGHCPACLQEKAAHRVSRIKAEDSPLTDTIMVTLTYRRNDCPYVFREDAYKFACGEFRDYIYYSSLDDRTEHLEICDLPLSVYRDNNYRKVRMSKDYLIGYKNIGAKILCSIPPSYIQLSKDKAKTIKKISFKNNKDLAHCHGKIGVIYYPDVQDFVERLRVNLRRNYGFDKNFKVYCTGEYGTKSKRPHFHVLMWIPKGSFETFRAAINASWPFSRICDFDRRVEKCFRAASYVASYVNQSDNFPDFLKVYFKPKHSFSKDFGCNLGVYSLASILSKFQRGTLSYFKQVTKDGQPTVVECPIPKYIIHRYFPKFKGYNRIAPTSLLECMQRFAKFDYGQKSILNVSSPQMYGINRLAYPVFYTNDDVYKISVRLNNAYQKFLSLAPFGFDLSLTDYCLLHNRVWRLYDSTILRMHLTNDDVPINEKYDNLGSIKCRYENINDIPSLRNYVLPIGFSPDMLLVVDPNMFVSVQQNTKRFADSYRDNIKHRSVANTIMSLQCEEF